MARVLQNAQFQLAPIAVPMPGSWDAAARAAYEQGKAEGFAEGHAAGRTVGRADLEAVADRVVHAAAACSDDVRTLHIELMARVMEVAELYVSTVVRHVPDSSAVSLLRRIEEALAALEPGILELQVDAPLVSEMAELFAGHDSGSTITVVPGRGLQPGEYRIRSEWAEVDGTWQRYLDAAREAVAMYLAEHVR